MDTRARRQRSNSRSTLPRVIGPMEGVSGRQSAPDVRGGPWTAITDPFAASSVTATLESLDGRLRGLSDRLASAEQREAYRKAVFQQACERLATRHAEVQALIRRVERVRYRRLIVRLRQILGAHLPRGTTVAVVSRGDQQLVTVPGRRAWHFPQAKTGVYAGHHPADSRAAIDHLEQLRARGARYLVVPRTAFWWLDHYRGFSDHLQRWSTCLFRDEQTCVLFALGARRKAK